MSRFEASMPFIKMASIFDLTSTDPTVTTSAFKERALLGLLERFGRAQTVTYSRKDTATGEVSTHTVTGQPLVRDPVFVNPEKPEEFENMKVAVIREWAILTSVFARATPETKRGFTSRTMHTYLNASPDFPLVTQLCNLVWCLPVTSVEDERPSAGLKS